MNVLVVCFGNKFRSPLCSAFLKNLCPDMTVKSAGFYDGHTRADKSFREYAARYGLDLGGHRSTLITPELITWADVIVVMGEAHRRRVNEEFPLRTSTRTVSL